jgi:hypothetical protein
VFAGVVPDTGDVAVGAELFVSAQGLADENPAQKIDYQPLNVDHICSGISDIYLGKDWESGQAQKLPYKGHKDV